MTRSHDQNRQWRMYCDQDGCETRSEPFPTEPPLQMFQERGWFIAKLFGDVCPACLAFGVQPKVRAHTSLNFLGDNGRHTPAEEPRPDHPAVPVTDPGAATKPLDGNPSPPVVEGGEHSGAVAGAVTPAPPSDSRDRLLCRNCGYPITLVNYARGPKWMHQNPAAAFMDGAYEYCHLSVATPTENPSPRVHCPGGEVASPTDAVDVDASVGGAPKNVPDSTPG